MKIKKPKVIIKENVEALTRNRNDFFNYVNEYYNRPTDFPNSSYYFHKRVIEMREKLGRR